MPNRKAIVRSPLYSTQSLNTAENRDIHQTVPDHRVKLTPDGWKQVCVFHVPSTKPYQSLAHAPLPKAEEAGMKLRSLLRPDDTLHFFTSPYRRTRETTEGILNALTSSNPTPSPFPRNTIKVYEEPRLREQDFGNFQPCSAEMSRMWQERADYGHFFYRIPNGESAADAYDRVSGFNESLWRSFGEDDFASVCVLVTHGLMTRVFLMKWYHFSVEYFEDLRNVNHCEFVVMKLNPDNGKFILQNQLRTWSQLKRERANSAVSQPPQSPIPVRKRWGGCPDGCDHEDEERARIKAARRQNTADLFMDDDTVRQIEQAAKKRSSRAAETRGANHEGEHLRGRDDAPLSPKTIPSSQNPTAPTAPTPNIPTLSPLTPSLISEGGRDGGGSLSGAASRSGSLTPDTDADAKEHMQILPVRSSMAMALHGELDGEGLGIDRARADALGDQSDVDDDEGGVEGSVL